MTDADLGGPMSNDPATRARQLRWSAAKMRELAAKPTDDGRRLHLFLADGLEAEAALLDRGLHTVSTGNGGTRVVAFSTVDEEVLV